MERKQRSKGDVASVPLSAMIDVVFLLLIYFVVTQKPIIVDVHLNSDLPNGGPQRNLLSVPPFKIDVMASDDADVYRIDGRRVLQRRLATMNPETTIMVS